MNERKKRIICIVLLGVMVFTALPQTSKAAELQHIEESWVNNGTISVCANNITNMKVWIDISNGKVSILASVAGSLNTTKIHAKIILQKYSKGSWNAVKTYEDTVSKAQYSLNRQRAVSKGRFRVKAIFTVYKGSKAETATKYSNTATCS